MRVALALGSNVGDRMNNLRKAVQILDSKGVHVVAKSDIFETAPLGEVEQTRFLNACILVETSMGAFALLDLVKQIEKDMGRIERWRWGPREIDIDLLLLENGECIDDKRLRIPHPEMHRRSFVLVPLNQIAANWVHPQLRVTISSLVETLKDKDKTLIKISSL
ncbi:MULTISPECIES: 2-amino-4-hydroxy-6-hydroxymethyldihydropteridine diphosphokinase [Aminobacterium]|jgi:2-amino-4-hydroxy-6-hydroxymethyldihydropteridine diphosphokinase|uniref:2-amino-4-hydroxy-6- hydroxymethyldihydropteridine diphosphokinase n=1 Tax=Aminobacterium TaxID=81466 RepID=UPI00257EEA03|nr:MULTISPECIES: 2-amino-4-hydroxy-6-hydroxymethyldihydropteridine diphosphokinase [unclassified Aminobacterium]